jgi:hypothetical protein
VLFNRYALARFLVLGHQLSWEGPASGEFSSGASPLRSCSYILRCESDSSGLAAQGESHPGVRLCESVYGIAGVVGIVIRKPRSLARGVRIWSIAPPSVGLRSPLRANPARREGDRRMLGLFSSRTVVEGSAPNRSDASIGRRRVNGNQRCSPVLVPIGELYDATSKRWASAGPREPPGDGGSWLESVGEGGSSFAHAVRSGTER